MWLLLTAIFALFCGHQGADYSVYDNADHYWDFEQTPVSDAVDLRTSRKIITHDVVQKIRSPSQNAIRVTEKAWVDLNLNTAQIPCLLDPSNCTNGLTVSLLLKNRPHSNDDKQHLFGNPLVYRNFSRGVGVFFLHSPWQFNVHVVSSKHVCRMQYGRIPVLWSLLSFRWTKDGTLSAYIWGSKIHHKHIACEQASGVPAQTNNYTLGYNSKSTVDYDDIAIWYRAVTDVELRLMWDDLFVTNGGGTKLNVEVTFGNNPLSGSPSIAEEDRLQNQMKTGLQNIYHASNRFTSVEINSYSGDSLKANVTLQFKVFWTNESLLLAEALGGGHITSSSNVTITQCFSDYLEHCMPLHIYSVEPESNTKFNIHFKEPSCYDSWQRLAYYVFYKAASETAWRKQFIRTCYSHTKRAKASVHSLQPYTNYTVMLMTLTFQGANIATWPPRTVLTLEDKPNKHPTVTNVTLSANNEIIIEWDPTSIPEKNWRGVPQGFTVSWWVDKCIGIVNTRLPLNVSSYVVRNLRGNLKYQVKVAGRTRPGEGQPKTDVLRTHPRPLRSPPEYIKIFNTSSTTMRIEWTEVHFCERQSEVLGYNLDVTDIEGGVSLAKYTVSANESRIVDLSNLTIYWTYGVRIRAYSHLGAGPYSEEHKNKTDESIPIVAPYNVSAYNTSSSSIRVHWKFDVNKTREILGVLRGFRIFYKRSDGSGAALVKWRDKTAETAQIEQLDVYTLYNVSLAAKTRKGHGPRSTTVVVRTRGEAPGHAPHPIRMFNTSSTSLQVEWGEVPVTYVYGPIIGYRLLLRKDNYDAVLEYRNFTRFNHTTDFQDLRKFTVYRVIIWAYSKEGEGVPGEVQAQTDEDVPTCPPTNLTAYSTSSTSIMVSWQYVLWSCHNGIIRGYRLMLTNAFTGQSELNYTIADPNQLSFEIFQLWKYNWYSLSILAFTVKGNGPDSPPFLVRTAEDVPKTAPYDVKGHHTSSTSLLLQWKFDTADTNVLGIHRGFSVYYKNINDTRSYWWWRVDLLDPRAYGYELRNLKKYRDYSIRVAGRTSVGPGERSNAIILRTDEDIPISPPSNARGSNTSSTSLQVAWDEVPFPDQLGIILGYRGLLWRTNQSDVILYNQTVDPETRALSFSGLEKFTNYTFQVLAFNVKGSGPASPALIVITDEDMPTRKPRTVAAWNTSSTSIMVAWQPLADEYYLHGLLRGYNLSFRRTDGRGSKRNLLFCENQLAGEISGLDEFTNYTMQICAFNSKGASPEQEIQCITDQDAPSAPPQNVTGYNLTKHDIYVHWNLVPKDDTNGIILGYRVFFKETHGSDAQEYNLTVHFPDRNVTLSPLRPFTFHSIQVCAFTAKGDGPRSTAIVVQTEEEAPQVAPWNVTGHNTSSTDLSIRWDPIPPEQVAGVLRLYRVMYNELNDVGEVVKSQSTYLPTSTLFVELGNLTKYTNYTIEVQGITKYYGIRSSPIRITTAEDVPSRPPQEPHARNISSTSLLITWKPIQKGSVNGILRGYRVSFSVKETRRRRRGITIGKVFTVLPNTTFLLVDNLEKFTVYTYSVLGFTVMGDGVSTQRGEIATDEDVPSKQPTNVSVVNQTAPHTITVFWQPVPKEYMHGLLRGYRVLYKKVKVADEGVSGLEIIKTVDQWTLNTTLFEMDNFAVYRISVLAFTVKGDGPRSKAIYAETCRCRKVLSTNWYDHTPYISFTNATARGIIPFVLEPAIDFCCKRCIHGHGESVIDYVFDGRNHSAKKRSNSELMRQINHNTDLSFPLIGFAEQQKYGIHKYVGLLESGGVAYVVMTESTEERAHIIFQAVLHTAPSLLLTSLVLIIVGICMWTLERNSTGYSPSFIEGAIDGTWWAFTTMTTVGYGDKTALSIPGRLFAISWTLMGLVISSILVAQITNELVSYTVTASNKRVYGAKVATIYDSPEYRLGVRKNALVDTGTKYFTYEDVNKALVNKEVDGALVDLYTYSNKQDLFSHPSLRIVKVMDYKTTYGVVMSGDTMKLQKCLNGFVKFNRGKVFGYVEENVQIVEKHKPISEEISSGLFDSESKQFFQSVFMTGLLLVFGLVCGSVYDVCRRRVQRNKVAACHAEKVSNLRDLTLIVGEFNENVRILIGDLKRKHFVEWQRLRSIKKRQKGYEVPDKNLVITRMDTMKNMQEELKKFNFETYA